MNSKRQQTKLNDETSGGWASFASHRRRVTAIANAAAEEFESDTALPTCCILGAGNGNDLDLSAIAPHFSAIHLFDIDQSALSRIKDRYNGQPDVLSRLVFEDPVDVSAVFKSLDHYRGSAANLSLNELIQSARKVSLNGTSLADRKFDVVISVCLLSQLINAVVDSFGGDEQVMNSVLLAVRDGHLNLLVRLCSQTGRSILITDFVSSDTLPQLTEANDDEKLLAAARIAIDDRNFFSGTNPWAIIETIRPQLRGPAQDTLEVSPPWRWQLGPRFYAVTAITFSKRE